MSDKQCPVCTGKAPDDYDYFESYCTEHDVCITCGIARKGLGYAPWGVKVGSFLCRDCESIGRKARVEQRIADGFSHEYTGEVTCPHCGYEHSDSWEMRDSDDDMDCPECEKKFTMERIVTCDYSTEKKE